MSGIGGINPAQAMHQLFCDLGEIAGEYAHADDTQRNPGEFLRALDGILETATALLNATFSSMVHSLDIPEESLKEFLSWQQLRRQLESDDDKKARQMRLLERFNQPLRPGDIGSLGGMDGFENMPAEMREAMIAMTRQSAQDDPTVEIEGRELASHPQCPEWFKDFIRECFGD